jgi:FMN phosphatase YigB (HAD superfamily)
MTRYWIIDFDDTLATGPVTWGMRYAIPKLVEKHQLPFDQQRFDRASMDAQRESNVQLDLRKVVRTFFEAMNWDTQLADSLIADVQSSYRPALFEDALPLLERLRKRQEKIYVISNNPRSLRTADMLDIRRYLEGILTPTEENGFKPKPDLSMWEHLRKTVPDLRTENTVVVGDDPWSDAIFAHAAGIACWIVDRERRFQSTQLPYGVQVIESLYALPIFDSPAPG